MQPKNVVEYKGSSTCDHKHGPVDYFSKVWANKRPVFLQMFFIGQVSIISL
jgi:hypothetical protein